MVGLDVDTAIIDSDDDDISGVAVTLSHSQPSSDVFTFTLCAPDGLMNAHGVTSDEVRFGSDSRVCRDAGNDALPCFTRTRNGRDYIDSAKGSQDPLAAVSSRLPGDAVQTISGSKVLVVLFAVMLVMIILLG